MVLHSSDLLASVLVSVVPQYSGVSAGPVGASVDFLVVVLVLIKETCVVLAPECSCVLSRCSRSASSDLGSCKDVVVVSRNDPEERNPYKVSVLEYKMHSKMKSENFCFLIFATAVTPCACRVKDASRATGNNRHIYRFCLELSL